MSRARTNKADYKAEDYKGQAKELETLQDSAPMEVAEELPVVQGSGTGQRIRPVARQPDCCSSTMERGPRDDTSFLFAANICRRKGRASTP